MITNTKIIQSQAFHNQGNDKYGNMEYVENNNVNILGSRNGSGNGKGVVNVPRI